MSILENHNIKNRKKEGRPYFWWTSQIFESRQSSLEVKNIYIFFEKETKNYSRAVSDYWRTQSDHKRQFNGVKCRVPKIQKDNLLIGR